MGKQKQQVISRFFAPKPNNSSSSSSSSSSIPALSSSPSPSGAHPPTPPSKITATVTFSPSKRLLSSQLTSTQSKRPKLSPHTHNPVTSNPTLHQKFLQKFLEPPFSDLSQPPPQANNIKYTPLEQQVVDLKKKHPDVLLMVEVGYRYRFFGEDAEIAARVLGIYCHMDHNFMTASVPTFRLNFHVRRLVNAGYKVGVVKQTETAAIKAHGSNKLGPFCRGLSALYTKATLEAAEDIGGREEECGKESNYLLCVVENSVLVESLDCGIEKGFDVKIGMVAVEISTGDILYGEFNDNFMRSGLEAVVLSLSPSELILGEPLSKLTEKLLLSYAGPASNVRVERASQDCFSNGGALAEVMSLYENLDRDYLADNQKKTAELTKPESGHLAVEVIMNMPDSAVRALALTIRHLKQFGFESILCLGASFRPFSTKLELALSANALQQLEVLKNNADGSESGSLLQSMNQTLTISGSRLLRHWVTHPLCDRQMIYARLDAVSEIAEHMTSSKVSQNYGDIDIEQCDVTDVKPELNYLLSNVLTNLGRAPDIQRGITRIYHKTATPSEFIAVTQAILYAGKQLQQLQIQVEDNEKLRPNTVRSVLLKKLIETASSSSLIGNAAKLLSTLNKEAADQGDQINLIIYSDQFPEVARTRKEVLFAKQKLDSLISLYRKQLGMRTLEFMSVSGTTHLIELVSDVKVPSNWVKASSTKKTIRYHPPEVLTALDQLSLANEELIVACRAAWNNFLIGFNKHYTEFQAAVQALATLDCLHSLAILSRSKNYVRPEFVYDDEPAQIHVCSGRHPILETLLQDSFVPNDTNLQSDKERCQIITGPNMGGKSCYIRQVALIAIMAQVGSFVPASSAKLHVLDGIYTRMGASDSIQRGRSTFLEELSETSHILHNCTENSLVIIDELGRGTSTHDGVAIAYATLHYLLQKKCIVLFVTHYLKITDIIHEFPGSVGPYHVSYLTSRVCNNSSLLESESNDDDVTFLYKLVPGVAERSFGFKVAQLAQLPLSCIARATKIGAWLEALVNRRAENKPGKEQLQEALCTGLNQEGTMDYDSVEIRDAYEDFFSALKAALFDDDHAESFSSLNHARSIAKDLITM